MQNKFIELPEEYLLSPQFQTDMTEEVHRRVDRFHACLVPWLRRVHPLAGARVVEIGSGTGSATLAFAPYVDHIHCFEIEAKTTAVAKERLGFWDFENVTFENGLFDRSAPFLAGHQAFDIVLLVAVLEHLHFREFKEVLSLALEAIQPGGLIVVAETPNRLSMRDYHTSWIDFFQWLPPELKLEYYRFSPRPHFVHHIGEVLRAHGPGSQETEEAFVRWGRGVSFHDFEIVFSEKIHEMIVLDGWEDEVRPLAPVFDDDNILVDIFNKYNVRAHKAFSRSWLYLVIQKPAASA